MRYSVNWVMRRAFIKPTTCEDVLQETGEYFLMMT